MFDDDNTTTLLYSSRPCPLPPSASTPSSAAPRACGDRSKSPCGARAASVRSFGRMPSALALFSFFCGGRAPPAAIGARSQPGKVLWNSWRAAVNLASPAFSGVLSIRCAATTSAGRTHLPPLCSLLVRDGLPRASSSGFCGPVYFLRAPHGAHGRWVLLFPRALRFALRSSVSIR